MKRDGGYRERLGFGGCQRDGEERVAFDGNGGHCGFESGGKV